jgi:hypothetical protein
MKWAGRVVFMGEMRNAYNILVRKSDVKRLFGTLRHRWVDNIKMCGDMN